MIIQRFDEMNERIEELLEHEQCEYKEELEAAKAIFDIDLFEKTLKNECVAVGMFLSLLSQ